MTSWQQVQDVTSSWLGFSSHARKCDGCGPAASVFRAGPAVWMDSFNHVHEDPIRFDLQWSRCCDGGRLLLEAWKAAVEILADTWKSERPKIIRIWR